jgi:hypothetical protein
VVLSKILEADLGLALAEGGEDLEQVDNIVDVAVEILGEVCQSNYSIHQV